MWSFYLNFASEHRLSENPLQGGVAHSDSGRGAPGWVLRHERASRSLRLPPLPGGLGPWAQINASMQPSEKSLRFVYKNQVLHFRCRGDACTTTGGNHSQLGAGFQPAARVCTFLRQGETICPPWQGNRSFEKASPRSLRQGVPRMLRPPVVPLRKGDKKSQTFGLAVQASSLQRCWKPYHRPATGVAGGTPAVPALLLYQLFLRIL